MDHARTFTLAALLILASCGGDGDFADRFSAACAAESDMPEAVCACLADRAERDLSDDARSLLLALVEKDEAAAERIRSSIAVTEAMQAGLLLTEAGSCAAAPEVPAGP